MRRTIEWSHHAVLAADAASAGKARDFVGLHLLEHDLGRLVEDVRLVVSELATNAMVHARTAFGVTLEGSGRSVLLTVQDGSTTLPSRRHAGDLDLGGRGVSIIEIVSRDWGVNEWPGRGKSVWASFDAPVDVHSSALS
jgi:hypothetical protein